MDGPTFLIAAAMVSGTILLMVKIIAGAFASGKGSSSDLARIRDKSDLHAAMLEETQATLATQSAQLAELQERLDFTERMLTQARSREALPPGEPGG